MSKYVYVFFTGLFFFFIVMPVLAIDTRTYAKGDKKQAELPDVEYVDQEKKWEMKGYDLPWVVVDSNGDGKNDVATRVRPNGYKKMLEVLDSNFDGLADDFAYFDETGSMLFQEIDSNYDKKIDLWISIKDGKYMKRFQRDKDFDGYVDIDRVF